MSISKKFVLFLECSSQEWDAWNERIPMTASLFEQLTDRLCQLELFDELMILFQKYPWLAQKHYDQIMSELHKKNEL